MSYFLFLSCTAQTIQDSILASFINQKYRKTSCHKLKIVKEYVNHSEFIISQIDCINRSLKTISLSDSLTITNINTIDKEFICPKAIKSMTNIKLGFISKKRIFKLEKKNSKEADKLASQIDMDKDEIKICLSKIVRIRDPISISSGNYLLYRITGFYKNNYTYSFYLASLNNIGQWEFEELNCSGTG